MFLKSLFIFFIRLYQMTISPFLGPRCRFFPSCSEYAAECLKKYNTAAALKKGTLRIFRCHPFNPGGVDLP
ncbi:MAG: membrane protein insertion efficiency factor YidD [Oligoflexales bacterium]